MRGRYENLSEASSLFSTRPLNSRASSKTAVVTPLEDFRTSRYIKPDVLSEPTLTASPIEDYPKPSSRIVTSERLLPRGTKESLEPEPYGPYFSIPVKTNNKPALARRGTTKELIGRYESLSTERSPEEKRRHTPPPVEEASVQGPVDDERRRKGRSPIRQSFRNLLSVFSKKGKPARDASTHVSDLLQAQEYCSPNGKDNYSPFPPVPSKSPALLQIPSSDIRLQSPDECTTPVPLYTGQLHYLCKPILPNGLPVWINCDVGLHNTHIVVTWRSVSGNPSTSLVQLPQCTDIRSLSLDDLEPTEAQLLPSDRGSGDLKVFELLFEGRVREKFAAVSVKERAGWVNAIWDVVLRASEQRTPSIRRPSTATTDTWGLSSSHVEVADPSLEAGPKVSTVAPLPERELPSVTLTPSRVMESAKVQLYDPPVSRAVPPVMTPDKSTWSRLPTPGGRSSSILNLDQKSMVKQRLAEIERSSSISSTGSPTKSTRSRQILSPTESSLPRQSVLLRHGTISSIGQQSAIDSYGGSKANSPISPLSGRLSSIPSGQSIGNEENPWLDRLSKLHAASPQASERPDVFSPASRYSDGLPATPTRTLPPILTLKTDLPRSSPVALPSPSRWLEAHRRVPQEPAPLPPPSKSRSIPPVPRLPNQAIADPAPKHKPPPVSKPLLAASSEPCHSSILANREQQTRLSNIRHQISEVKAELKGLPETLGAVVAERTLPPLPTSTEQDEESKMLLQNIDDTMKRVEGQGERNEQGLTGIHAKVDALLELRQAVSPTVDGQLGVTHETADAMMAKLEEIRDQIKMDIPALSQRLEEFVAQKPLDASTSGGEAPPPGEPPVQPLAGPTVEDIAGLQDRLREILSAVQTSHPLPAKDEGGTDGPTANKMIEEMLSLVKEEQAKREEQVTQQADSARYLNELNTWLETFVKHGTSQIESVAAGVQHLCKELGPTVVVGEDGQSIPQDAAGGVGLLTEVRQMLAENRQRGDHVGALQMTVEGLMAAVHENIQTAEARNQFPTDTMMALIDQQRQNQEHMLKALATELSNDIRGERLRFVEAMKEATTINVQIHVEEFKKELTREVVSMTQEVSRLQRERQVLEQQIADLFAFYAKQKQAGEAKQSSKKKGRPPPQGVSPAQGSERPLPVPSQPAYMYGAM